MFSKKATNIDEIFTVDLTVTTYSQIDGEYFVNFCGLLRKHDFYTALHCGLCGACEGLGFGLRSASQVNYISYLA